eukprot:TRINITY_DN938_c0_g1_i6.p1 TRINITY_DN938_c0_g1~~TRINITY_DN938_c0_g1_i6.p1  ORF type:complete len:421 (+),score=67.89 TRINITY_DN938_c0_g1_i6:113-1375(+)
MKKGDAVEAINARIYEVDTQGAPGTLEKLLGLMDALGFKVADGVVPQYNIDHGVLVKRMRKWKGREGYIFCDRDEQVSLVVEHVVNDVARGLPQDKSHKPLFSVQQAPGFGKSTFLTHLPVEIDKALRKANLKPAIYCPFSFDDTMRERCTAERDDAWSMGWRMLYGAFKAMAGSTLRWDGVAPQLRELHTDVHFNFDTFHSAARTVFGASDATPVVFLADEFDMQDAQEGTPGTSFRILYSAMRSSTTHAFAVISHHKSRGLFETGSQRPIQPITLGILSCEARLAIMKNRGFQVDSDAAIMRLGFVANFGFGHPLAMQFAEAIMCCLRRSSKDTNTILNSIFDVGYVKAIRHLEDFITTKRACRYKVKQLRTIGVAILRQVIYYSIMTRSPSAELHKLVLQGVGMARVSDLEDRYPAA